MIDVLSTSVRNIYLQSRFGAGAAARKVFLLLLLISNSAAASEIHSIKENNSALSKIENKDATGAEKDLLSALGEDPFNPILHLNLGWLFEQEEKPEMAVKEYDSVLRIENAPDELKFIANFNAGNAAAAKKEPDIESALQHYQAALEFKPDSKETKTNIEMLLKGGQGKGKGGGKGKGKDKDKDQSKGDGENQDPNKENPQNRDPNYKPKFESKDLTKEDVRKILDEIKSQETKIRALEYGQKSKDSAPGKDW